MEELQTLTLILKEGDKVKTRCGKVFFIHNGNLEHPTEHYIPLEEYNEWGENLLNSDLDIIGDAS